MLVRLLEAGAGKFLSPDKQPKYKHGVFYQYGYVERAKISW